ncbi:alpha/beta fold hydrolase [Nocardia suismassiliense]|uniref:alpha/beta fold hydrolase n=1 Tax=Nocardia suismassiliense TaxID=2077092 RepID=UPI001F1AA6CF|nr:alpha/beta hydrolase [Nocardia suismassiliense]
MSTKGIRLGRTLLIGMAVALSMAVTACSAKADKPAIEQPVDKPSVLLVHGAFADGSSWTKVAEKLQRDGYQVTTAAVPLRGLTYDSAYIRGVLDGMPGKTIVVGHSYGGAVITNAATGSPKAAGLVYIAAFAPDRGESLGELDGRFGGPATKISVPHEYPLPDGKGNAPELTIAPDKFGEFFAQDLPATDAAVLAAGQRPIAVASFTEPSAEPAWKTLPSWTLVAKDDRMIPPDGQRQMATRINATVVEHAGSHAIALSQPQAVVDLIETAAAKTS